MHFAETMVKINVYCLFVSNKLSTIAGFSFMVSWLGVLGNVVCYCLHSCTEILTFILVSG